MRIVLCHGLLGFDTLNIVPLRLQRLLYGNSASSHIFGLSYWGRHLVKHLNAECQASASTKGHESQVWIPRVPATASVESRAKILWQYLDAKTRDSPTPITVHLLAHSMGGLDARFMLSKMKPMEKCRVLSLTTLATPHRGSSYIDWLAELVGLKSSTVSDNILEKVKTVAGHTDWLSKLETMLLTAPLIARDIRAFRQLSTEYACQHFSASAVPDVPTVKYYSYGGSVSDAQKASMGQKMSWRIINEREGPNDGLVSVKSSEWGDYCGTLDCNHDDLVAIWPWRTQFDTKKFYSRHLQLLRECERKHSE